MIVRNILFSEGVLGIGEGIPQGKNAIINPTVSYILQFIPSAFSFNIFIMLQGLPTDSVELKIVFRKNGEDKHLVEMVNQIDGKIFTNEKVPKEIAGLNLNIPIINLPIEEAGEYVCEVFIDGILEKEEKLAILKI